MARVGDANPGESFFDVPYDSGREDALKKSGSNMPIRQLKKELETVRSKQKKLDALLRLEGAIDSKRKMSSVVPVMIKLLDDKNIEVAYKAAELVKKYGFSKISKDKAKIKVQTLLLLNQYSLEPEKNVNTILKMGKKAIPLVSKFLGKKEIADYAVTTLDEAAKRGMDISSALESIEHYHKSSGTLPEALVYHYLDKKEWNKVGEFFEEERIENVTWALAKRVENGVDITPLASHIIKLLGSLGRLLDAPEPYENMTTLLGGIKKEKLTDMAKEASEREVEIKSKDLVDASGSADIFSAFSMLSRFFSEYAKGCEEGNAPVLGKKGAEAASKLLVMSQISYWALTDRSFIFDHVREGKMDKIVSEDAIEKNLPEGWTKHVKKYVRALYYGARTQKEERFLGQLSNIEILFGKNFNFKEARKVWYFFYINNCLSKEDKTKYKEFVEGRKPRKELKLGRIANG